jgi:hypothetical protein
MPALLQQVARLQQRRRRHRRRRLTVSHSCACIESPCLRHCVHGASIGGGLGDSPAYRALVGFLEGQLGFKAQENYARLLSAAGVSLDDIPTITDVRCLPAQPPRRFAGGWLTGCWSQPASQPASAIEAQWMLNGGHGASLWDG